MQQNEQNATQKLSANVPRAFAICIQPASGPTSCLTAWRPRWDSLEKLWTWWGL